MRCGYHTEMVATIGVRHNAHSLAPLPKIKNGFWEGGKNVEISSPENVLTVSGEGVLGVRYQCAGIVGIVAPNFSRAELQRANDLLAHRESDEAGHVCRRWRQHRRAAVEHY